MNYIRIVMIAVTLAMAAFTQLHTQPVAETLTVDTLCYLGKGIAGEAGGAYFLPDGNIIALWKGRPLILDSKSGEVIRQLDALSTGFAGAPKLSPDGTKLAATITGPKFTVWDVPSGKILTTLENVKGYCFSSDSRKLYVCGGNSSGLGAIRVLDVNTFEEVERFGTFVSGLRMDISSDDQTIAISVYKTPNGEYDKKVNQVVLLNLNDKKNFSIIETLEESVKSMEFSPDGKQIAFLHEGSSFDDIYIYII